MKIYLKPELDNIPVWYYFQIWQYIEQEKLSR